MSIYFFDLKNIVPVELGPVTDGKHSDISPVGIAFQAEFLHSGADLIPDLFRKFFFQADQHLLTLKAEYGGR